jgi:hypothetical protein
MRFKTLALKTEGNIADNRQVLKIWENCITELYNQPEKLEVKPKQEVDADEKGLYILHSEVEKAVKETRDKNATGDDDVPGDVLKLLGEDGLRKMTQQINIMESGPRISLKFQ